MSALRGTAVIADHDLWSYFAERFGLRVVAFLEPKPGVAPSTAHLQSVVEQVREQKVGAVLSVGYFSRRHAEFVARATGIPIVDMAHQVGARAGADDYLGMVDHNVDAVVAALRAAKARD
jgi:ABC-type Zn uptake system ZnuABC Zn-binding protein ZnuA